MDNVILGIHCGYMHDSGAALVVNGEIRSIILQERMSRKKKDPYFPKEAILKCLEVGGVRPEQVNTVAFAAKDIQFQPEQLSEDYFQKNGGYFTGTLKRSSFAEVISTKKWIRQYQQNVEAGIRPFHDQLVTNLNGLGLNKDVKITYCDHHSCHVASIYYTSGSVKADNGYIFVIDGYGDEKSVSAYTFGPDTEFPEKILDMHFLSSPGLMYSHTTEYLGMKPFRHEGKVTGLSGYGDPNILYDATEKFLKYNQKEKRFEVSAFEKSKFMARVHRGVSLIKNMIGNSRKCVGKPILEQMGTIFNGHSKEDIAAAVQKRFDDEVTTFVKDVIGNEKPGAIFLAGGIFANVKTNAMVADLYPESELYVHPGMTDEGVSLGAALRADYEANGRSTRRPLNHVYWGPGYSPEFIDEFVAGLDSKTYDVQSFDRNTKDGEAKAAELIAGGKIVGLFYGRMEYGPRALGARSIMADTRDRGVNDRLNNRLHRTEYMPFAPVVLEEKADDIFDIGDNIRYTSRFMTVICDVKDEWRNRIGAVVHVDGTARPQLIDEETNPVYYHIVKEYDKLTGIPVLVNTSFNAHEEPILEHPSHGINSLNQDNIDFLYLYPYLISVKK